MAEGRTRIAVFGGGMSALAAVFELTSRPDWREQYDITVYQPGWRLGGKGASGRNAAHHQRIEEHGMHVWAGYYEHAFRLMDRVYAAWDTAPPQLKPQRNHPGGNRMAWAEAFQGTNDVTLEEPLGNDEWAHWIMPYPRRPGIPGDGDPLPPPIIQLVALVKQMILHARQLPLPPTTGWGRARRAAWRQVGRPFMAFQLTLVLRLLEQIPPAWLEPELPRRAVLRRLARVIPHVDRVQNWAWQTWEHVIETSPELRRAWVLFDLGLAAVHGAITDDVLWRGYDHLDDEDWCEWLERHGAMRDPTLRSGVVRACYDYPFAYVDGDASRPRLSAAVALHGMGLIMFGYKRAVFWRMKGGMGDVVFTPLYEVLAKRGVKFAFFHQLLSVTPAADGARIERVRVRRQADLRAPAAGYDPFVTVQGMHCWPSEPRYEQLARGAELAALAIDLEAPDAAWPGATDVDLHAGEDFDVVLLATSLEPLKTICAALADQQAAWRDMLTHLKTVATGAMQLWFADASGAMGWPAPPTVMAGYVAPFTAWAGLGHLIELEDWPADDAPRSLAYFCGPLPDKPQPATHASLRTDAMQWLDRYAGHLWPRAADPNNARGLNYDKLHAPAGVAGRARFNAQYWRANTQGSARYVLSLPGTLKYRLTPGTSGYANLVLAGDWLRTSINAGCIEAAVMSGLEAAGVIAERRP